MLARIILLTAALAANKILCAILSYSYMQAKIASIYGVTTYLFIVNILWDDHKNHLVDKSFRELLNFE